MAVQSYRRRVRVAFGLAAVAAIAAGIIGGRVVRAGAPGENFWLVYSVLLAIFALAFAALLPWWRKLDDMQKSGHLVSYYWGGMGGGLAVMAALVAATGVDSRLSLGALYTVLGQAAGFLLFLAGWRLRRGDPAA
jgi:hypothetical protein